MAFKMQCPKCGSTSLYLEEDQKAFVGGGRHQVQLHCYMCGKVIYGQDSIEAEYKKQHGQWQSTHGGSESAAVMSSNTDENKDLKAEGALEGEDSNNEEKGMPTCAWRDCDKTARPRSKYCSRNCSNKNARSRYSSRNDEEAA